MKEKEKTKDARLAAWSSRWPLLGLPLMILMGFSVLHFVFGASVFVSVIYAVIVALLTIWLASVFGRQLAGTVDLETFMKSSRGLVMEQRREEAKQKLASLQLQSLRAQTWKNRKDFAIKVLTVVIALSAYAWAAFLIWGVAPQMALLGLPLGVVIALSLALCVLMSRGSLTVTLVIFTVVAVAVSTLGIMVILQMAQYLLMMPMFMFMNLMIMFGPMMYFNLRQQQYVLPGSAEWGVMFDEIRGQEEARNQILQVLAVTLSEDRSMGVLRERGIMMWGPPGVGKTLMAKAIATHLNCPVVLTTGAAFTSTFVGIGIVVAVFMKWRVAKLQREYGRVIVFIDEAEQVFSRRAGMAQPQAGGFRSAGFYSNFGYDQFGACGDVVFDSEEALELAWAEKYPPGVSTTQAAFMMPGMGMGGGSMAQPVFLSWMDGVPTPPWFERFWRTKVNFLLDALLVIPTVIVWRGKTRVLRVAPATPEEDRTLFLAATNQPEMIDPAMLRPGRFGRQVHFILPGEAERMDIADLYLAKMDAAGLLHPDLKRPERAREFAAASIGFSPAQIMHAIQGAAGLQRAHVLYVRELADRVKSGEQLVGRDARSWERFQYQVGTENWDRFWATWDSLLESMRSIRYGLAKPTRTSAKHRETTAVHETVGHLLTLAAFCKEFLKPTVLSIMPRGSTLGLVASAPIEEHDPLPQRFYDGMLRMLLGSKVAESLYFGESQPGVVSDLSIATKSAAQMVGLYGMGPRQCSSADWTRYAEIGQRLTSFADMSMIGSGGDSPTAILGNSSKYELVCVLQGQAFVDAYRVIIKYRRLTDEVVKLVLEQDEIMGADLDSIWQRMCSQISSPAPLTVEDSAWPDDLIVSMNPFYAMEGAV